MDKRYFIELTNKVYRLTLLFPKREVLRYKIRGIADEILADLIVILEGEPKERREAALNVERNIEIMDALFELAKKQGWVLSREITDIQEEYREIKEEVEEFNKIVHREIRASGEEVVPPKERVLSQELPKEKKESVEKESLNKRQEEIMSFMKENDQVQIKDIQNLFPKVTKRTLRRDVSLLLEKGLVKRAGKANSTYYSISDSVRT